MVSTDRYTHRRLRSAILAAAGLSILIGGFMLVAWLTGAAARWSAARNVITMKTNMALALVLAGSGLVLLGAFPGHKAGRWIGLAAAAFILLVSGLTLSEHLMGWDLGIDQILAEEAPGALSTDSPNRMGLPGSTCHAILGVALLLLGTGRRRIVPYLGLAVILINLVPALGFLYGISEFFSRHITFIAWPTVLSMLCLGLGLVLSCPEGSLMAILLRDDAGGRMLRGLLPVAFLLPLGLGFLKMMGDQWGVLDASARTGLLILAIMLFFALVLWHSAGQLSRADDEQKQAEAEIRRQRELSDVTLSSIGDGVIVTDVDGRVTFINAEAVRLTGWTNQDATGQPLTAVFKIINEQTRQAVDSPVEKVLQVGGVVGLANHTILLTRDGREIPIDDSGAPIRGSDGSVRGVVLIFRDIIERKAAEQSLHSIAQFPDENPYPVLRIDSGGIVLYANRACATLIDDCRCEVGQPAPKALAKPAAEAMTSGSARQVEVQNAGRTLSFLCAPIAGSRYINLYGSDITERKQAEQALRQSEERFRLMGDTIPFGAWMADAEGRNIYISPLFLELVGMTFEQVKEFGWTNKMPPEDVEPTMRRWTECVRTGRDFF